MWIKGNGEKFPWLLYICLYFLSGIRQNYNFTASFRQSKPPSPETCHKQIILCWGGKIKCHLKLRRAKTSYNSKNNSQVFALSIFKVKLRKPIIIIKNNSSVFADAPRPEAEGVTRLMADKVLRPQRGRTVFSAHQLNELENVFVIDQYISGQQRRRLSAQLGLTETQVRVWFQNRRIKWRKNKMERKMRLSSSWCVNKWLPGKHSSKMCKQLLGCFRKEDFFEKKYHLAFQLPLVSLSNFHSNLTEIIFPSFSCSALWQSYIPNLNM